MDNKNNRNTDTSLQESSESKKALDFDELEDVNGGMFVITTGVKSEAKAHQSEGISQRRPVQSPAKKLGETKFC